MLGIAPLSSLPLSSLPTGGNPLSVSPGAGAVVFTGFSPSVSGLPVSVSPGTGAALFTGRAPAISQTTVGGGGEDYSQSGYTQDGTRLLDSSARPEERRRRLEETRRALGLVPPEPVPVVVAPPLPEPPDTTLSDALALDAATAARNDVIAGLEAQIADQMAEQKRLDRIRRDDEDVLMLLAALT